MTLNADWASSYSISYVLGRGSFSSEVKRSYYPAESFILPTPSCPGYRFAGWYKDSSYRGKVSSVGRNCKGDLEFHAKWLPNAYSVKYLGNGAESGNMPISNYHYGTFDFLRPNNFKRKGYVFKGWNSMSDGSGTAFKNMETMTNHLEIDGTQLTLYAMWEKLSYDIEYVLGRGELPAGTPRQYSVDSAFTLPAPVRSGYNFQGWYKDGSYRSKVSNVAMGNTGELEFLAKWSANSYTFIYKGNGGSGRMLPTRFACGTDTYLRANGFKRQGFRFVGWNTAPDGSGRAFAQMETVTDYVDANGATIKLYAQWEQIA